MKSTVSGVAVDRRSLDLVPGQSLRPLRDHIIVKPLEWRPSALIRIAGDTRKPLRGVVVAVGPGCHPWRYSADRSKRWQSKSFRKTEVRVGDEVELGSLPDDALGITGYAFPQVLIGNEVHLVCREEDVCAIRDAK